MRTFSLWLMTAFLICAPLRASSEGVYLRVVGSDDTFTAQAQKLAVRDAVLDVFKDAPAFTPALYQDMKNAATSAAACDVRLKLWRPSHDYPLAPTVYITLGEGRGRNWWGVLYEDSLFFFSEDDGSEDVTFRWTIWEMIKAFFGF